MCALSIELKYIKLAEYLKSTSVLFFVQSCFCKVLFKMLALLTIAVLILWLLYKKLTGKFKLFEDRGVKFEEPVIIFGNILDVIRGKRDIFSVVQTLYEKFHSEKYDTIFLGFAGTESAAG